MESVSPRMPVQPLTPGQPVSGPPALQPAASEQEDLQPTSVWLQRISLFILVLFCVYLGALVAILPWWSAVWDHNPLLHAYPRLWSVLRTGPARGIISGCGLLDIWIGISEAIHYREHRS